MSTTAEEHARSCLVRCQPSVVASSVKAQGVSRPFTEILGSFGGVAVLVTIPSRRALLSSTQYCVGARYGYGEEPSRHSNRGTKPKSAKEPRSMM